MIDTTLVPFAIAFVVLGAVVAAVATAVIVDAVRELRSTPRPVVVSIDRPGQELGRVA
jgi:hypothetical protein